MPAQLEKALNTRLGGIVRARARGAAAKRMGRKIFPFGLGQLRLQDLVRVQNGGVEAIPLNKATEMLLESWRIL